MALYIDRSPKATGRFAWCVLFTRVGIITQPVTCFCVNLATLVPFRSAPLKAHHSN